MSSEFHIDAERGLAVFTAVGRLTNDEFFGCPNLIRAHPDFRSGLCYLVDLTGVDRHDPMPDDMQARAHMDLTDFQYDLGPSRIALVANTAHVYGMIRMYEILMQEARLMVRTFRSVDEACAWLGVDPAGEGPAVART